MALNVIVLGEDEDEEVEWIGFVMKCPLCKTMWMMDCDTCLNYCPHCGAELTYHKYRRE